MVKMAVLLVMLAMLALAGCAGGAARPSAATDEFDIIDIAPAARAGPEPPEAGTHTGRVGERSYRFRVPRDYDGSRPAPLVILLHGYGGSGWVQDLYFGFGRLAEQRGFLYAYPDGTRDARGLRFWNAIPGLGEAGSSLPDDVAYISAIIDDMGTRFRVDARRVYLVGHSNGAFLAYRYACEHPTRIAAIAGLAGAMLADPATCSPPAGVAVLHIHGDADTGIAYAGGTMRRVPYLGGCATASPAVRYRGAVDSVARWAGFNGCGALQPAGTALDLDASLPGAETSVARHSGCTRGAAELWTMHGAGHVPAVGPEWAGAIYDWLTAHARP